MDVLVCGLELHLADGFDLVGLRRGRQVVEQRAAAREPLDPEQLLGVEAAVGLPELGVALLRNAAVADVVHRPTSVAGV
jgi:hypothetical protein